MGLSESHTTEMNEETPEEVEGAVHKNGNASGLTFLQTEYRPSRAL